MDGNNQYGINEMPVFSHPGESFQMRSYAMPYFGVLFALGIAGLLSTRFLGILVGIAFISLSIYLVSIVINKVNFLEGAIYVNFYGLRSPKKIDYNNLGVIIPKREPRTGKRIFVVKTKTGKPIKKITWHCTDKEFTEMRDFLLERRVRIGRED